MIKNVPKANQFVFKMPSPTDKTRYSVESTSPISLDQATEKWRAWVNQNGPLLHSRIRKIIRIPFGK
jgi:hypothetical protein